MEHRFIIISSLIALMVGIPILPTTAQHNHQEHPVPTTQILHQIPENEKKGVLID